MHAHEGADGNLEKAAVQDPVGEADVDVGARWVDDKNKFGEVEAEINFEGAGRKVEGAEITAVFPLLSLFVLTTATSPRVI